MLLLNSPSVGTRRTNLAEKRREEDDLNDVQRVLDILDDVRRAIVRR